MINTEENILIEAESKVIKPNPKSLALRSSLPKEIVSILKLNDKDVIKWKALTKNDIPYVIVEKAD